MPRVKSNVARLKRKNKVMKLAKGYWGGRSKLWKAAKEATERAAQVRLSRPPQQEGRVPSPLDHAHQRGSPTARVVLQQVHEWAAQSRCRSESQGPRRSRRPGSGGV